MGGGERIAHQLEAAGVCSLFKRVFTPALSTNAWAE
jgi:hypothetical protein